MSEPLYTREILRLASQIPYLGLLDNPDGAAGLRSPTCGSSVQVTLRLDLEGRISELGQAVTACAFGQASAALMGAHVIGRSRDEVAAGVVGLAAWLVGASENSGPWPGLVILAPAREKNGRHGAILLPFRALLAAIDSAT